MKQVSEFVDEKFLVTDDLIKSKSRYTPDIY